MEPVTFLKIKLEELANKFQNLKLSYFLDAQYSQHVIIVNPAKIYFDEKFADAQVKLEMEFINEFPYESLYFVEKGGIEITQEFEFECGSRFANELLFQNESFTYLFGLTEIKPTVNLSSSKITSANSVPQNNIVNDNPTDLLSNLSTGSVFDDIENSYAMAA